MEKLDAVLAYKAMFRFLDNYWERGHHNDEQIAVLLGNMSLETFGGDKPGDPSMWSDWLEAIEEVMAAQVHHSDEQSKGSTT